MNGYCFELKDRIINILEEDDAREQFEEMLGEVDDFMHDEAQNIWKVEYRQKRLREPDSHV